LDKLISKHIVCNEPVIFEGDGIIPSLIAKRDLGKVKAVFLYDDEEQLYERSFNRKRNNQAIDVLKKHAEFSSKFGAEVKAQAENNNFLTIKASPLDTLLERVLKLL